ncbi:MAG: SUF system NifU family Fe-S cluster assembly protein [Leptospiraceae bacterium]|nr:SUF system NifU family Fe-S cluster assembly protein [Leptospiraceae bacterium]MCK6381242.1 SUF system NifU family Fe-S cluster assembly protein [Leptospiraceae bacterium]
MSLSNDLYKEVIMDHFEHPRNYGSIANAHIHEKGVNPLCGDELEIFMNIENGIVKEVKFQGKGCSISQSSASMMVDAIEGKTKEEAMNLIKKFKGMILEDQEPDFNEELEDLSSLKGVKKYPVRVKCAVLPWNTLEKAFQS